MRRRASLVWCLGALACAVACLGTFAVRPAAAVTAPNLAGEVTGASLTVAATGERLYGLHPDRRLLIASTTKLMTALVVFQHVHDFGELVTMPNWRADAVDSQIGLDPGERMSVHDLMLALLLPSADDAAYDLAYNVGGGSVGRFVTDMNADAQALGLTNTHYENPIGLDAAGNYSSPYDLTRLGAYMMAHFPFFAHAVGLSHATLKTGAYIRHITSTDTLLGTEPWITGIKTGHTNAAGYILVSSATRNPLTLVASVLGTDSEAERNATALALLSYGYAAFRQVNPLRKGQVLGRPRVEEESRRAVVIAASGWQNVLARQDRIRVSTKLPRQLSGPRPAGARVGSATILVNGRPDGQVALVLGRAIPPVPTLTKLAHALGRPTTLGVLALLVGIALTALGLRRRGPQAAPVDRRQRARPQTR